MSNLWDINYLQTFSGNGEQSSNILNEFFEKAPKRKENQKDNMAPYLVFRSNLSKNERDEIEKKSASEVPSWVEGSKLNPETGTLYLCSGEKSCFESIQNSDGLAWRHGGHWETKDHLICKYFVAIPDVLQMIKDGRIGYLETENNSSSIKLNQISFRKKITFNLVSGLYMIDYTGDALEYPWIKNLATIATPDELSVSLRQTKPLSMIEKMANTSKQEEISQIRKPLKRSLRIQEVMKKIYFATRLKNAINFLLFFLEMQKATEVAEGSK